MAEVEHHDNHGQTPAAWTAVTIIMIGFLVGCVAVVLLNWALLAASVGIVAVGALVGKVMQMMGMGKPVSDPDTASQL
jgi:hypothetical protein